MKKMNLMKLSVAFLIGIAVLVVIYYIISLYTT